MHSDGSQNARLCLDVFAAFNRGDLPLEKLPWADADNIEGILAHPYQWAYFNDRQTEDILMELYVFRRFKSQ